MKAKQIVFIFTKNRTLTLDLSKFQTLNKSFAIYLIDDSTNDLQIKANKNLCTTSDIHYYGKDEHKKFLCEISLFGKKYVDLLGELGTNSWNLGHSRNNAILLSIKNHCSKAIFLDDDIVLPSKSHIQNIFLLLEKYDIVGSDIVGMKDDSVVGHISTILNFFTERVYSGGCMGFRVDKINHLFMNIYNEDWIWQYLHPSNAKIGFGSARQNDFDPFINFEVKMAFQEIGEIIVSGLAGLSYPDKQILLNPEYWKGIIIERRMYIETLIDFCNCDENIKHKNMLNYVLGLHDIDTPHAIAKEFAKYYENDQLLRNLKNYF